MLLLWGSVWLALIQTLNAAPVDYLFLDDLIDDDSNHAGDYDMTFDQRQNGTENIRLRIDGVIVAFPSSASSSAGSMAGNVAANYLLQLAAGADDDDNTESLDEYLSLLKSSNNPSVSSTTVAAEKAVETTTKDEKLLKKKVIVIPVKESEIKRVTVTKDDSEKSETSNDVLKNAAVTNDEQIRPVVVPVKKIQSRRRNKY